MAGKWVHTISKKDHHALSFSRLTRHLFPPLLPPLSSLLQQSGTIIVVVFQIMIKRLSTALATALALINTIVTIHAAEACVSELPPLSYYYY